MKPAVVVLDCDGVILDSNGIKTEAFREAVAGYGTEAAALLVDYHRRHGGISRHRKVRHFFDGILGREPHPGELESVLEAFGRASRSGLFRCAETRGFRDFMTALPGNARPYVVSGGLEIELRDVFRERELDALFHGIYGSPTTKEDNLERVFAHAGMRGPGIFFGDSEYDHVAASKAGLEFVFVSKYTEFGTWREYCAERGLRTVRTLKEWTW